MAVRKNIGLISHAIEVGRRAYNNIDFGPSIGMEITSIDRAVEDWGAMDTKNNVFIMGIHKWGNVNPDFRVGK